MRAVIVFLLIAGSGAMALAQEGSVCLPEGLFRMVDRALEIGEEYAGPGFGMAEMGSLLYLEPAEALRRQADRMDRHEADYLFLQEAVRAWKEYFGERKVQALVAPGR